MKFTGTAQGACCKRNHLRKVVKLENFTRSFKFLQTGQVYKLIVKKTNSRTFFETLSDRADYVEVDTLTHIPQF